MSRAALALAAPDLLTACTTTLTFLQRQFPEVDLPVKRMLEEAIEKATKA